MEVYLLSDNQQAKCERLLKINPIWCMGSEKGWPLKYQKESLKMLCGYLSVTYVRLHNSNLWSQKMSIPTPGRVFWKFQGEWGFKGKLVWTKTAISRRMREGVQNLKNLLLGGVWSLSIFILCNNIIAFWCSMHHPATWLNCFLFQSVASYWGLNRIWIL